MNKDGIRTMILWGLLALAAFISAFFIPVLWVKIVNLLFGGINMLVLLSWGISTRKAMKEYKRQSKLKEE